MVPGTEIPCGVGGFLGLVCSLSWYGLLCYSVPSSAEGVLVLKPSCSVRRDNWINCNSKQLPALLPPGFLIEAVLMNTGARARQAASMWWEKKSL